MNKYMIIEMCKTDRQVQKQLYKKLKNRNFLIDITLYVAEKI